MFWRKKEIVYPIPVLPLQKPFGKLKPKEAQAYFDWHQSVLQERIGILSEASGVDLDYTPESLLPLWHWFLKVGQVERTPPDQLKEMEAELSHGCNPLACEILKDQEKRLTLVTEYVILDIGMYLGEIYARNHPQLRWGFYTAPRRDIFVNQPCILGFPNEYFPEKPGVPFNPSHMVRIQALRLLKGGYSRYDLLEIYRKWENKL